MIKLVAYWAAIIAAVLIGYATTHVFDVSNQTMSLIILAATFFVVSFHSNWRISSLEERVIHKSYSDVKLAIEKGERHKPQHNQPKSLIDGGAVKSRITAAHEILFDDFRWFGVLLDSDFRGEIGWAIEEINDTDIREFEGPDVGRQYRVYYNACRMGTIEVAVGGHEWLSRPEAFAQNRQARVEVRLDYLRFVSFEAAHGLIYSIALYIGSFGDDGEAARSKAAGIATAALTGHLWESVRKPNIDMYFNFRMNGPYELLRRATDQWEAKGVDLSEKLGGDQL